MEKLTPAIASHPAFPEWVKLSPAVQKECGGSFTRFLAIRELGLLDGLIASVEQEATQAIKEKTRYEEGRAFEKSVERAPLDDAARWKIVKEHMAGHTEYPDLNTPGLKA